MEINELILVRKLYSLVLSYYLSSVKGGWHQLEDTVHFFLLKFDQVWCCLLLYEQLGTIYLLFGSDDITGINESAGTTIKFLFAAGHTR